MTGLIRNKHKAFVTALFWILRFIVHHNRMNSHLSLWPIDRLDFILRSAPIIFGRIHMNVEMIWRKILFEVLLFSELCCNPADMAAKCRPILLQKGFELSMNDRLSDHFFFFYVLPLYTTSTFFQMSYVKSCCFILSIIDEVFWSLYLTNASGFVAVILYFLSIFSFKA